jgi:hypothetical protein
MPLFKCCSATSHLQPLLLHLPHPLTSADGYYPSFKALCSTRALTLSQFCQATAVAGLDATLDAPAGFDHTVFVPSNKAFIAAKLDLGAGATAPSASAVADVLKYHVLAGPAQAVPALAAGKHETLLAGQFVEISYQGSKAFVNGGQIVKKNVYVGKVGVILHGIDITPLCRRCSTAMLSLLALCMPGGACTEIAIAVASPVGQPS